jgi:hypothetical protein
MRRDVRNLRYLKAFAARSIGVALYFRFQEQVSRALRIEFLEESVRDYSQLIKAFEADRVQLLRRQVGADAKEAAQMREALATNQRGLDLLNEARARVEQQLEQARSEPETEESSGPR